MATVMVIRLLNDIPGIGSASAKFPINIDDYRNGNFFNSIYTREEVEHKYEVFDWNEASPDIIAVEKIKIYNIINASFFVVYHVVDVNSPKRKPVIPFLRVYRSNPDDGVEFVDLYGNPEFAFNIAKDFNVPYINTENSTIHNVPKLIAPPFDFSANAIEACIMEYAETYTF